MDRIFVGIGMVVLLGVLSFILMTWADSNGYRHAQAECAAKIQAAADKQAAQAHAASSDYQAAKAQQEQKQKEKVVYVEKIIKRDVYRNQCFDTDGVRLINKAARGK